MGSAGIQVKAFLVWVYTSIGKVEMALHQDQGTEEQATIGTLTLIIVSSHLSAVLSFSLQFSLQPAATYNYSISHFTPQRHISKVFLWQGRTRRAMVKSWSLFLTV